MNKGDFTTLVREASKRHGLPVGYINTLIKKGVVSVPFSHIDELILSAFAKVWRSETLLKIAISKVPKSKRQELLAPFSRLEQFVYTRLCEFYREGKIITSDQLIFELRAKGFHIPAQGAGLERVKKRIKSLRRRCRKELEKEQ